MGVESQEDFWFGELTKSFNVPFSFDVFPWGLLRRPGSVRVGEEKFSLAPYQDPPFFEDSICRLSLATTTKNVRSQSFKA
jgi:hypothetical protein